MIPMFKTLGLTLAACVLAAADIPDKRLEVAPGQLLEVNLATGGAIRIRGGAENAVTVRTKLSGRDADLIRVAVERTRGGVSVTAKFEGGGSRRNGSADLDITVPARFDTGLKTLGGELVLEGLEGQLQGSTMGGPLNLSNLKGKVDFSTMGGAITLTSSQVDGRVKTMGGNVRIKDVTGDIKGSSMGGNVVYDNVQRPGKGDGKAVEISTMGGEIQVPSAPSGATLKTMGGAIHVGSAREFVRATTMGGNIEIKELDGAAAVSTMGGDIAVTMVGDPAQGRRDVKLESKGGEIRLTLPATLSAEFDVELDHTRNSTRTYKIDSDFPLAITETPDWTESHGSPRKTLKGVATVNGGRHKIVIRTINGNVTIRRR